VTRHRDGSTRYTGNTEWWDGGPRYVLGLHGSIILNLDDDGSDLDVVIMVRGMLVIPGQGNCRR
jgi:hypothetical protein